MEEKNLSQEEQTVKPWPFAYLLKIMIQPGFNGCPIDLILNHTDLIINHTKTYNIIRLDRQTESWWILICFT